jgi:hypothetical protein
MKSLITLVTAASLAVAAHATSYSFVPSDKDLGDLNHTSAYTWGISGTSELNLKNQLLSGDYMITSAVLTIANIYNWDKRDTNNQLFIHLLDNPLNGLKQITDDPTDNGINQGVLSDYFAGPLPTNKVNGKYVAYGYKNKSSAQLLFTGANTNTYLTQYHDADGPQTKENFTFSFNNTLLAVLDDYITNGHTQGSSYADFGLGFDPDCHFYNDGITFTITTARIPPPPPVPDNGATLVLLGSATVGLALFRRKTARR